MMLLNCRRARRIPGRQRSPGCNTAVVAEASPLPIIAVRVIEGRVGSTLLMNLLGTSPAVVFDRRYPAEYRFLSYFAHMAEQMTEPFDAERHLRVTPFFFGDQPTWGPVPFTTEVLDVGTLTSPLLRSMWAAWSEQARVARPTARFYAEKLAVPIEPLLAAHLDLRLIDLVRDPRDILASIRSFTARGTDGFRRRAGQSEAEYLTGFVERTVERVGLLHATPSTVDQLVLRYEDLAGDVEAAAVRIGRWLGLELDPATVLAQPDPKRHRTTPSVAESIGRWRRDLSAEEAATIAAALRVPMAQFGYDL